MKVEKKKADYIQPNRIEAEESDYLYTQLSQLKDAGQGLFTAVDIYKHEVISLFKGEILGNKEADIRAKSNNNKYFINLLDGSILDSMHTDCYAKYANDAEGHSTSQFKNNARITLDDDDNVCITALSKIKSREEVFCGYGKAYWKKHREN